MPVERQYRTSPSPRLTNSYWLISSWTVRGVWLDLPTVCMSIWAFYRCFPSSDHLAIPSSEYPVHQLSALESSFGSLPDPKVDIGIRESGEYSSQPRSHTSSSLPLEPPDSNSRSQTTLPRQPSPTRSFRHSIPVIFSQFRQSPFGFF